MAEQPISRWVGIVLLLAMAVVFGSNHIAARVAFEHGANVTTAVAFRSTGTALFVFALLVLNGISLKVPGQTLQRSLLIGLLLSAQSYCLYSAVALIPVALALLAFQTFPMVLALVSWLSGGERPSVRVRMAMPVALIGLALALDVTGKSGDMSGRWSEIGPGVLWASGASLSFAMVLLLTTRWLGGMDGRLRSFLTMSVVAAVTLAGGAITQSFAFPSDGTGWMALVLLTVFYGTAITSMFVLLPRLGAVNNAAVLNFEPIAVLGLAWLILGQAVAPLQILGAFIVVGAIMWMGSGKKMTARTTRLCVVRHGETAWNAEHRVQGQLDVPLNATGLAQARAASKVLGREKFDAIYSSDLSRARQTAQPVLDFLPLKIILEKELRERHYGIFESLTYAEVKVKFPGDYARFEAREPDYAFRTGESLKDFSARSIAAVTKIAERHEGQSILVFTHGGVLDHLHRFITGQPLSTERGFGIPNAGLNRIEVTPAGWKILAWAEVAHLKGALDDLPG